MKKIFSVLLFMALFSSSVFGIKLSDYGLYPFQVETGTRPLSLSMAFSGLANDETSAFYNPGGLPWSKGIMLCIDNASNLAASQAYPTGFGSTFGISVVQTNLSSYEAPNSQIIDFSNNILFISLGSKLSAIPFMGPIPQSENIGLGINFKTILGQTLRPLGSFDRTAQGWELDFGALYKASPWLSMGLNAQNIMPQGTDMMSGGVIKWDDGTLENVPAVLNAGVSAKIIGDKNSPLYLEGNEARFNMDIHSQREIPSWGSFGIEWGYKGTLFARVGTFIKDGVKDAISTGFGLRFGGWGMDFSQSKSVITNENKMSISILYDPEEWVFEKKPEEKKAPKLEIKDPFIFLSPSYESSTYEDSITVYGRVQKGLGVAVNSQKIELTSLDEFSAYVPLNPGKNLILIDVTSGEAKSTFERKVLKKPKVVISEEKELSSALSSTKDEGKKKEIKTELIKVEERKQKVEALVALGVVDVEQNEAFKLNAPVTRGELSSWLVKSANIPLPLVKKQEFQDVPINHPYATYIKAAVDNSLMEAKGNKFYPDSPVSKQEAEEIFRKFGVVK